MIRIHVNDKINLDWILFQGVGSPNATMHEAIHIPYAALQAIIAAGTPTPPVLTPATPPAAATHATQTVLHPV